MEFYEKLQRLRTERHLTQEQLATQLYVSRTAVSKWESGRGLPNLESLKAISRLFSVPIDTLLSDEALPAPAVPARSRRLLSGALAFLPLFSRREGPLVRAVSLVSGPTLSPALCGLLTAALLALALCGILPLLLRRSGAWLRPPILTLHAGIVLLCALTRQPYATVLLFLLLLVRLSLVLHPASDKAEKGP